MSEASACVGLDWLPLCSGASLGAFFSIGQLLTVLSFALAFSQLTRPIVRFRLQAKGISFWSVAWVVGFGTAFVFLAAIMAHLAAPRPALFGYPIYWELLSGLLFVVLGFALIAYSTKKAQFGGSNARSYLEACRAVIVKGSPEAMRELAEEVIEAVPSVFKCCSAFDAQAARQASKSGLPLNVSDSTRSAFSTLELWSDATFCKVIVCSAPDTAIAMIQGFKSVKRGSRPGYALCRQLIRQSFLEESSLLMREEDFSGLGFNKKYRSALFDDWAFVNGLYSPLDHWHLYKDEARDWQVKKYCECVAAALTSYLKANNFHENPWSLRRALDHLSSVAMRQAWQLQSMGPGVGYSSSPIQVLNEVQSGLVGFVEILSSCEDAVIAQFEGISEAGVSTSAAQAPIYEAMAKGMYDYLEALSTARSNDELVRMCAITLWLEVFPVAAAKFTASQKALSAHLLAQMEEKLEDNFRIEHPLYPPLARLLLSINGIHEPASDATQRADTEFHRKFINMIKDSFVALEKSDPQFAEHLLPDGFVYDKANQELRHSRRRMQTDVLKLNPVSAETRSAQLTGE
jgi:hypothetical protein